MSDFRFLTMEEFSRLPRLEKVRYIAEAAQAIEKAGSEGELSLFRDGPPLPALNGADD